MKGNKQLYSKYKAERVKGYKKLLKEQDKSYEPPEHIAKDIIEAMSAQGYKVDLEQVTAYMRSSYAVFDRDYHKRDR